MYWFRGNPILSNTLTLASEEFRSICHPNIRHDRISVWYWQNDTSNECGNLSLETFWRLPQDRPLYRLLLAISAQCWWEFCPVMACLQYMANTGNMSRLLEFWSLLPAGLSTYWVPVQVTSLTISSRDMRSQTIRCGGGGGGGPSSSSCPPFSSAAISASISSSICTSSGACIPYRAPWRATCTTHTTRYFIPAELFGQKLTMFWHS